MNYYPPSIQNVIKNISRLPGIGEKTAERLALHILKTPRIEAEHLARSILELKDKIRLCSGCFALSDSNLCSICSNPARDSSLLCVVEQPADMVSVEKSGAFQGLYHILSGVLSPMNGVGPNDIKIRELISRVKEGNVKRSFSPQAQILKEKQLPLILLSFLINFLSRLHESHQAFPWEVT